MTEMQTRFLMPKAGTRLSGTYLARLERVTATKSKFNDKAQMALEFRTEKDTPFTLYLTVSSRKSVQTFLDAGVLRKVGEEEVELVPKIEQPWVRVTLDEGKLREIIKVHKEI